MDKDILGIGSRVKHPAYGDGVIIRIHKAAYDVSFILYGIKQVGKHYDKWEIIEAEEAKEEVSFSGMEEAMLRILKAYDLIGEHVEIADKFKDGTIIFQPEVENLSSKELPIETFFHKIVMVRDKLRIIEQKINGSKNLSEDEKVQLQQYITRIYGSLTSFNVLFKEKEDNFVGQRS